MHNLSKKVYGYFCENGRFHLTKELVTKFGVVRPLFRTDGFSIPWFLRWFHNPFGIGLIAAIWHDYALSIQDKMAHSQFLDLLLDHAITIERRWMRNLFIIKAYIMFVMVVLYGHYKQAKSYLLKKILNR